MGGIHLRARLISKVTALALVAIVGAATAFPNYYTQFSQRYPTTSLLNNYGCNICHKDRGSNGCRNPYGADVSLTMGQNGIDFDTLEGMDSDGDGLSNLDEITSGTAPGRPDPTTIVNRLLGKTPAANGDADVNCGLCEQGCAAEIYVVDCADVIDSLFVPDYYQLPDRGYVSVKDQIRISEP